MRASRRLGVALAALAVTFPLAGCLSAAELPSHQDVAAVHVHTYVGEDKVGYPVDPSSPAGQDLVNLTLEAIGRTAGPINITAWDEPARALTGPSVDVSFAEPINITWAGETPSGLEGVREAQLLLETANGTPNLFLRTAETWTFYHAPVDTSSLQEAAERALDVIRAENDGELPHPAVQVKRPGTTSGNVTSGNQTAKGA